MPKSQKRPEYATDVADCIRQGDGRYNFGQSLYLIVRGGSVLWEHQFREGGKLKTKCFGSARGAAKVGLRKAQTLVYAATVERRTGREVARNAKYHGGNHSNGNGNGNGASLLKPFSVVRDEYFAKMQGGESPQWTEGQYDTISRMLKKHAAPIDSRPVGELTKEEIADMLRPKWKGPGSHTGNRVRGLVEKILRASGIKNDDNPALWENLQTELSGNVKKSVPRASLPYQEVPRLMRDLAENTTMQAKALRFMILTGTRQDEVLEMTWREVDLAAKVWTIPAERMKMADPHDVPLSDAAIAILNECTPRAADDLVFPSMMGGRMSQQTTRDLAQELRPKIKLTVHGFRSSMSTWAEEQETPDGTELYSEKVILAGIAHYKGDANKKAYLRSKLFNARKKMMQAWSQYATGKPIA
jgi:integrase